MNRELDKIPGALWNFSQPIADNMEEAVSGVKGQLAIKIYGDDLKTLEAKGGEIVNVMRSIKGVADLGLFRVIGQPNLEFRWTAPKPRATVSMSPTFRTRSRRRWAARPSSQVLQGEQRYDLVVRYQAPYRSTKEAMENIRLLAPSGRAGGARPTLRRAGSRRRFGDLSRRRTRVTWPSSTAWKGAIWAARWKKRLQKVHEAGEAPGRVPHRLGRRIRKREAFAEAPR